MGMMGMKRKESVKWQNKHIKTNGPPVFFNR